MLLILTLFSSTFLPTVQNAAATVDSGAEADDTRPTVRITSPEKSPRKLVTISGPSSGVTLNLEGTALDAESSIEKVEVKINDPTTLQLLKNYTLATATGPGGEHDFSTWAKSLTFNQEGTYRVCARATDEAGNLNWWHVLVAVEFGNKHVNGKIIFTSDRDGGNFQIYVMNADGTNQTNLSNIAAGEGASSWSPDGTKIAFGTYIDGNSEVYVMNADGTGRTRVTNNDAEDGGASWSPDGTKLAFSTGRNGYPEVYVMNADGTNQTRLTNNEADDYGPRWSPDGSKIAFTSFRDGNKEIYVMNADGTNQTNLSNIGAHDSAPSWSPDGSKIAFSSNRDGDYGDIDIYVMNADGTEPTRLTHTSVDRDPNWSPDGTKIAFGKSIDGNHELYVMNADGTEPTRLTNNDAGDFGPIWGVDTNSS